MINLKSKKVIIKQIKDTHWLHQLLYVLSFRKYGSMYKIVNEKMLQWNPSQQHNCRCAVEPLLPDRPFLRENEIYKLNLPLPKVRKGHTNKKIYSVENGFDLNSAICWLKEHCPEIECDIVQLRHEIQIHIDPYKKSIAKDIYSVFKENTPGMFSIQVLRKEPK